MSLTGKGTRIVQPHYPVVRASSQRDHVNQQLVISSQREANSLEVTNSSTIDN